MSPAAFQLWRDYFQLAKLVEEMNRYGPSEEEPGPQAAELSPERQQEHQLFPRQRRRQQQRRQQLVDESPSAARGRDEFSCSFCKQNGESRSIYSSHRLKDEAGRVQCPILRKYKCPQCGASGDFAHTRRFCPLTKEGYISVYTSFIRNSAGKRKKRCHNSTFLKNGETVGLIIHVESLVLRTQFLNNLKSNAEYFLTNLI